MNKRFIPSLVIFGKGMMIIAIGILFKFLHYPGAKVLLIIGSVLIFISLLVLLIMYLIKLKE
jgi:hypothetical protein